MTGEPALAQLREAYRGTGLEVRFYPDWALEAMVELELVLESTYALV
jgi:hypothetical protein